MFGLQFGRISYRLLLPHKEEAEDDAFMVTLKSCHSQGQP